MLKLIEEGVKAFVRRYENEEGLSRRSRVLQLFAVGMAQRRCFASAGGGEVPRLQRSVTVHEAY